MPQTANLLNIADTHTNNVAQQQNVPSGISQLMNAKNAPSQMGTGSSPNLATKALPTAGAIAGGIGGGIGGTALAGALLPEETALAPETFGLSYLPSAIAYLGGVLGAGLGQAGGKAAENVMTGQPAQNKLAQNFLYGAGGQAGGEVLGKGLSMLGTKVVAPTLEKGASKLIGGQLKGAQGDIGQYSKTIQQSNISDIRQVPSLFSRITGGLGAVTKGVSDALTTSNIKVDMGGFLDTVKNELQSQPLIQKNAENKLLSTAQKTLFNLTGKKGGQVGVQGADPNAVLNEVRNWEKLAQQNSAKGGTNAEAAAIGDFATNIARSLESSIFKPVDAAGNEIATPLTNQIKTSMKAGLADLQKTNPTLFNRISGQIDSAKTIKDARTIQSEYVGASKASQDAIKQQSAKSGVTGGQLAQIAAPVLGGLSAGPIGAGFGVAGALATTPTGERLITKGVQGLAGKAAGTTVPKTVIGKTLSNLPKGYPKALTGLTALGSTATNYGPQATGAAGQTQLTQGAGMQGAGAPGAAGAAPTQDINPNISTPIALMQLAAMTDPLIFQQMGGASALQNLTKPVAAAQTAQQGLQSLYNPTYGTGAQAGQITGLGGAYQQAGGGQGILGGGASGVLSRLFGGGETSRFAQQQSAEQNAVNAALKAQGLDINAPLPGITSTPQAAQAQLQYIQSLLNQLGGSMPQAQGGGYVPQGVLNSIPAGQ